MAEGAISLAEPRTLPRCVTPETNRRDSSLLIDFWLGAIVTLGVAGYLVYVLLRPERF